MSIGNDFLVWWNSHKGFECLKMISHIIMGSCLAFGLEVSEYFAVYKTSSITLSVVGIIKVSIICSIYFIFEIVLQLNNFIIRKSVP